MTFDLAFWKKVITPRIDPRGEHSFGAMTFKEFRYRTDEQGVAFGTEVRLQCSCGAHLIGNYPGNEAAARLHYAKDVTT